MNGIDYYRRAAELAERVASGHVSDYDAVAMASAANAYATLALAAATADASALKRELASAGRENNPRPMPVLFDDEEF